jgi:hemolysin activation/secretion protein
MKFENNNQLEMAKDSSEATSKQATFRELTSDELLVIGGGAAGRGGAAL